MCYARLLAFVLFASACHRHQDPAPISQPAEPLFSLTDSRITGVTFSNPIQHTEAQNIFSYRNFYNGGGVAIGDINNDQRPDLYFTSNLGENKLYVNQGNFRFEDVTQAAGVGGSRAWSTGVVMVDINADGLLDIYVCNAGNVKGDDRKNELFINNGDLTFSERAAEYRLDHEGTTTHAAFFDYDKDGDLDAYILNNSFIPVNSLHFSNKRARKADSWKVPDPLKGGGDVLLQNEGGTYVEVSQEAGIYSSLIGFGLGVTVGDINQDTYPDIYVSNDFYEHDYLYINQQDGTFKESIKTWTAHTSLFSMGADMADINNDGRLDIFVTDMLPQDDARLKQTTSFEGFDVQQRKRQLGFHEQYMQNTLQLNHEHEHLTEIAHFAGIASTDWSWGALLFDADNDGFRDIYVTNGIVHDLTDQDFIDYFSSTIIQKMVLSGKKEAVDAIIDKMPSTPLANVAFQNKHDLTFSEATQPWGLAAPGFSNGAAYGDLDNDGDLDLVVNNINQQAFVYRNNAQALYAHHYLKIRLQGNAPNTFGLGSRVTLYHGKQRIVQEQMPSRGFQSSVAQEMTIGLGNWETLDSLQLLWPDNTQQTLVAIDTDTLLTLWQADAKTNTVHTVPLSAPQLTALPLQIAPHVENDFVDFDHEGLLSEMHSREGPALALGDINGDGLHDMLIGGAKGQPDRLFVQKTAGTFWPTQQARFAATTPSETTAATFFDADNDGDLDLATGGGGNEPDHAAQYRNLLYINDGQGTFANPRSLPATGHNVAVVAPHDFDADGDTDLFVGARSVPGIYGIAPKHLLLQNDGAGNFTDISEQAAFQLQDVGMVTDAHWSDINQDGKSDLVLVGDWMAPVILENTGKRLRSTSSSLDTLSAQWTSLALADIDQDGDQDMVLGNRGSNRPYSPTPDSPMTLYVYDFDENGTIEQIATREIDGKARPILLKKELTGQLPLLQKDNLNHAQYAKKTIQELFDPHILNNALQKTSRYASSVVALNEGSFNFRVVPLPQKAQFSSVEAICIEDINGDGHQDLLFGGNHDNARPQFARQDASRGGLLLGKGNGRFEWLPYASSGFSVQGHIRHIRRVQSQDSTSFFLVVRNNDTPKLFTRND